MSTEEVEVLKDRFHSFILCVRNFQYLIDTLVLSPLCCKLPPNLANLGSPGSEFSSVAGWNIYTDPCLIWDPHGHHVMTPIFCRHQILVVVLFFFGRFYDYFSVIVQKAQRNTRIGSSAFLKRSLIAPDAHIKPKPKTSSIAIRISLP